MKFVEKVKTQLKETPDAKIEKFITSKVKSFAIYASTEVTLKQQELQLDEHRLEELKEQLAQAKENLKAAHYNLGSKEDLAKEISSNNSCHKTSFTQYINKLVDLQQKIYTIQESIDGLELEIKDKKFNLKFIKDIQKKLAE